MYFKGLFTVSTIINCEVHEQMCRLAHTCSSQVNVILSCLHSSKIQDLSQLTWL